MTPEEKLFDATPQELGQAAVDAAKKRCKCHWCTVIYPKIKLVSEQLHGEALIAFNFLTEYYDNIDLDKQVAEAKLDGSWPGWEKIKDFKPTHRHARNMHDASSNLAKGSNIRCLAQ